MRHILAALIFAVLFLVPAKADQVVTYDVIPPEHRSSDAISFSAASWTELVYAAPGVTCYSCFGRTLFMSTDYLRPAKRVVFEFGFYDNTGSSQLRLVSFYVDASGNRIYDRTWPIVVKTPCCNPSPPFVDVTAQWNNYFASLPVMTGGPNRNGVMFLLEVVGSGQVFMARIAVDY